MSGASEEVRGRGGEGVGRRFVMFVTVDVCVCEFTRGVVRRSVFAVLLSRSSSDEGLQVADHFGFEANKLLFKKTMK